MIKARLSEIIVIAATEYEIEPQELYGKSKSRKTSAARKVLIYPCLEYGLVTNREISKERRLSDTAITILTTRRLEDQREREERILAMSHCQA